MFRRVARFRKRCRRRQARWTAGIERAAVAVSKSFAVAKDLQLLKFVPNGRGT